ncbi:MAG: hypothetical protein IJ927_05460 [Eubacterium sp.]|nr:hypothetical protein [Eubacterium sp.]
MDTKKTKTNKSFWLWITFLFFMFFALALFFPYTGDDWAWGSQIGIDRLNAKFGNYNGRYLGNLLVMLITRNKVLDAAVMSLSYCVMSATPYFLIKKKNLSYLFLSALFLIALPRNILLQSYVWTAGFSNYVPPILLVMLYIVIIKNIFGEEKPKYSKILPFFAFLIGGSACLFMENITLYCLALGFLVILYCIIKFRKVFITHIAYLLGCFVGTGIMFSNSAYLNIINNKDGYRSVSGSEESGSTLHSLVIHVDEITKRLFTCNVYLCITVSILIIVVAFLCIKHANKKKKVLVSINTFVHTLMLTMIVSYSGFTSWKFRVTDKTTTKTVAFIALICAIYALTILVQVLLCIEGKEERDILVLLLLSTFIIVAPLLVVSPIGPRCFFPPYFVMVVFAVYLLYYIIDHIKGAEKISAALSPALLVGCVGVFIFLFTIYVPMHHYDALRLEYINKQIDKGQKTVTMCELPYSEYAWMPNPKEELWTERYKLFYGIDKDIEFEYVSAKKYDKWIAEFNETNK